MLKKWLIFLFAPLLLTLLTSCPITRKAATVTIWMDTNEREMEIAKKAAGMFQKEYPHIHIEFKFIPFQDLKAAYTGQARSGSPDLFFMVNDWIGELAQKNLLKPVQIDRLNHLPITIQSLTLNEQLYALPRSFQVVALVYNRSLIQEPPFTVSEMLKKAKKLEKEGQQGLMYDNKNFYYHAPWFFGYGAQIFDPDGNIHLNTSEAVQSLDFVRSLEKTHHIIPSQSDYATMMNLFNAGQVGMIITGPWSLVEIEKNNIPYGIAPLPFLDNGKSPRPFIGVKAIGINPFGSQQEAARQVADFFSSETIQALATRELNELPSLVKLYNTEQTPLHKQGFFKQSTNCVAMPTDPRMKYVWREMNWVLAQVFATRQPIPRLLQQAEQKIRAEVEKQEKL